MIEEKLLYPIIIPNTILITTFNMQIKSICTDNSKTAPNTTSFISTPKQRLLIQTNHIILYPQRVSFLASFHYGQCTSEQHTSISQDILRQEASSCFELIIFGNLPEIPGLCSGPGKSKLSPTITNTFCNVQQSTSSLSSETCSASLSPLVKTQPSNPRMGLRM